MNLRRIAWLSLSIMLAGSACTTTVEPLPTAPQLITSAEQQLQTQAFDQVLTTLEAVAGLKCPKRLRDRRDLLIAQAEFGRGRPWHAFLALEEFSSLHPHSDLRGQAVDVIWNAGNTLIKSDGGFLFFWSDERAGRTVLEHLITRHPETQHLSDALCILGDMAFDNGNYELARERYLDIIRNRPESHWRFYAQFRLAMSIVSSLRGPDYDLSRMELATAHLLGFLTASPEGPPMIEKATAALQQVRQWQVQRHLDVADFYRTLNSIEGQRHHLQLAVREDFIGVPGYERALQKRNAFEAANPKVPAESDAGKPAVPTGGRP